MIKYVVAYLAVACVMVVVDMLWLGVIAKSFYQGAIGHLMAEQPRVSAALAFYVLYTLGLMIFAVTPEPSNPAWQRAALMGALFGFFAYATYDLSNLATLNGWPVHLALADMLWGAALSALAAGAGKIALNMASKA
jgi:uncharacterized membrane protein